MNWKRLVSSFTAMFLCGISIGWMVGLSASPIVQGVITTVVTLLAGLAVFVATGAGPERLFGAQSAGQEGDRRAVPQSMRVLALWLVAVFVFSQTIGSSLGAFGRTNDLLGAMPNRFISRWKVTGLTEAEIASRLFDQLYPAEVSLRVDAAKSPLRGQFFATVAASEYEEFKAAGPGKLNRLMLDSTNPKVKSFAEECQGDEKCLKAAVNHLLQPKPR